MPSKLLLKSCMEYSLTSYISLNQKAILACLHQITYLLHLFGNIIEYEIISWFPKGPKYSIEASLPIIFFQFHELVENHKFVRIAKERGHAHFFHHLRIEELKSKHSKHNCIQKKVNTSLTIHGAWWTYLISPITKMNNSSCYRYILHSLPWEYCNFRGHRFLQTKLN